LQFDHIIPVALGGATSAQNLQLLCRQCNLAKSAGI
jgi:5-methylcytosine-specific restriction endonuclease McrA